MGQRILEFLGIQLPAFQIAGGIVLLLVALDMLRAQRSRVQETSEETAAGTAKDDIAITPLAVPMLAGPGAISTAILLHNRAESFMQEVFLCVAILIVGAITYAILHFSAHGARWLNPIVLRITTRIMGLLLAAVAVHHNRSEHAWLGWTLKRVAVLRREVAIVKARAVAPDSSH